MTITPLLICPVLGAVLATGAAVAMQRRPARRGAVPLYLIAVFGLSLTLSLVVGVTGGARSPIVGLGLLTMLFPALAVLVARVGTGERIAPDWSRLPLRYVPVALFLMPVVIHAAMLPATAMMEGGLLWQPWLTPHADGLYYAPDSLGWGILTTPALVVRMAANAVVGLAIVSLLALFEEIGWRAWLLPRIAAHLGARRALLVTAAIAAAWHVPYVVGGIHVIDGMSAADTAFIMTIGQAGAALVLGWLWLRTESIWIVALAHGALNNWGQHAFTYMQDFVAADPRIVLGAGNSALLVVGVMVLLTVSDTAVREPRAGDL